LRGEDTKWARAIERLGRVADPRSTVFLIHDFDWASTYAAASWGNVYPLIDTLMPAPENTPKFKRIGFVGGLLQEHGRTDAEQVDGLQWQIDHAFDLGYDVVVVRLWDVDQDFLNKLTGSIAPQSLTMAMTSMLHREFTAREIMNDPVLGRVYRLQRAEEP
jgi:hypothetical protein